MTKTAVTVGDQIMYRSTVKQISPCYCRNGDAHSKYRVGVPSIGRGSGLDFVWLCELRVDVLHKGDAGD